MNQKLKILLVDDNRTSLMLMGKLVEQTGLCSPVSYSNPLAVVEDLPRIDFDFAVVDYQMPGMSGIELIAELRRHPGNIDKPIVVVTGDHHAELRLAALQAGAMEFLTKPIDPVEFTTRVRNLARLCEVQRKLADRAAWLRAEVDAAVGELRRREEEIIHRLTLAAGYKDEDTAAHTIRMARMCGDIAREMNQPPEFCRDIELAAPMHDIGKVGIRDDVLLKRGRLEDPEMEHMREHARIGGDILEGSSCDLLQLASVIAMTHHERWDGTGYPNHISGTGIPLAGRIAAVADVYDALISSRPYKRAWSVQEATDYIAAQSGRQFDPSCVEAFLRVADRREPATEVAA
ncbi:histidine kinase [Aureimonas sp. Leaf454]|uniref:HD domain-containing phosphohydrolase n=1 Tax=Aureimonas sp. Leaf454 TaxID=1736381 RepID=UPI000701AD01|nr:HD domain-containing phosphohydrolase [Aureimonas sp. Leaf454]KQT54403.1 histidine kinase [Aureimonas sp. Leaf454]